MKLEGEETVMLRVLQKICQALSGAQMRGGPQLLILLRDGMRVFRLLKQADGPDNVSRRRIGKRGDVGTFRKGAIRFILPSECYQSWPLKLHHEWRFSQTKLLHATPKLSFAGDPYRLAGLGDKECSVIVTRQYLPDTRATR